MSFSIHREVASLPPDEADKVLVWARLAAGQTQQAVADGIGWSRSAVRDYAGLQQIDADAWEVVGATFSDFAPTDETEHAPTNGATAPSPFTEGLLRNILDLQSAQQIDLCQI